MNEREMEDLIAAYPDDFFPNKEFRLKGRQRSFAGVGRFDLLFLDRFGTNILMELKAVPARYEVATQLARYRDEMLSRGEKHILMWLVAPQIPSSVREFLDRIGIEYSEIHEAEFRRVAERYGVASGSEGEPVSSDLEGTQSSHRHISDATKNVMKTPSRNRGGRRTIYQNFKELMESAVLPQHALNPTHIRLDGQERGGNQEAAFKFRHHGKVWKINADTYYDRLIRAYEFIKTDDTRDPFVEVPTPKGNCMVLTKDVQRATTLKPTKKLIYIYEEPS